MNEPAIKLEEQIISMFPEQETQVCRGWILKKAEGNLCVYPLYYKFAKDETPEKIRRCEETARRGGMKCVFRIVEHTNYYLSAVLADRGYVAAGCGVVGVYEAEREEACRWLDAGILLLTDRDLPDSPELWTILHFPAESGIKKILADVPGREELPRGYEQAGFRRAYGYRVYRKAED